MANDAQLTFTLSPLTTAFTAPASCSASWTYEAESLNSVSGGLLLQNAETSFDTNCWPPAFTGNGRAPSNIQVYSPGVCPSGYATAGGFTYGGTTTEICCPSNFGYSSTYSSINYFGSSSVIFEGCISSYPIASGSTAVEARANNTAPSITTVTGPLTMWAQPIWIEYRQQDLPATSTSASLSTSPTASPSSTSTPTTATATSSPNAAATSSPNATVSTNTGLSTGAKAGIGVGAAFGGLFILVAIGLLFFRRRRAPTGQKVVPEISDRVSWERRELDGSDIRGELDGSHTNSIKRKPVPQERVELE